MYSRDTKEEAMQAINDEIAFYERRLAEMEAGSREYGEEAVSYTHLTLPTTPYV